ncbi:MAG: hypothetical protein H7Y43_16155 [Akkermansiaceae bacterium]|nr:hypothetical protein [Verrucomicrobiales bacterium]
MKMKSLLMVCAAFCSLFITVNTVHAIGTAFTYQGRLIDAGGPATGSYDFRFRLASDSLGNNLVAGPLITNAVPVSGGLFTVPLDFGTVFTGSNYWLQIDVKTNGAGGYTTLSPLQALTPTPYAIMATSASNLLGTLPAAQLSGTVGTGQLTDGAVTGAKILDGTISSLDLGPNSVNSGHIINGQVANVDLADNAVTSAKVLDLSLVGADLANNTVGSDQLADTIALGRSNVVGRLDVFYANTASNRPAISLLGSGSQISTYGSDSREQIRLWGPGYGEIYLFDNSAANNLAVILSSGGTSPYLRLNQGNSVSVGAQLLGDSVGGGRLLLYNSNAVANIDLRSQFSSTTTDAWASFNDNGSERITLAARNGTTGRGGLIDVKNNSSLNTIRLIGDTSSGDSRLEMYAGGTNLSLQIVADDSSSGSAIHLYDGTGDQRIEIDSDDGDNAAIIRLRNSAGVTTITLDAETGGDGRITTQELQITGGSDLSEQFDINSLRHEIKAGMIVCIDPRNPGQLVPSTTAYDRTCAGVISGAGGVKPGMLMGQRGTKADGYYPVALTGRVYCWMDATHGAIEPGDLVTTSTTPGHGMKANDQARSQGAIIGKAMTALTEGKGLVLILVSLQ